MLVKESRVKQWYRPSHPIYKNFAYLFKNELWDNPVPKGFTVCPYFWMSMASLLLFRPFVMLFLFCIKPILAALGGAVGGIDRWIQQRLFIFDGRRDEKFAPGFPVFVALFFAVLAVIGAAAALAAIGLVGALASATVTHGTPKENYALWSVLTLAGTALAVGIHKCKTKGKKDACRSQVWLVVWLALFIIASLCVIPNELWWCASGLWWLLSWAVYGVKVAVVAVALFIFHAVIFVAQALWAALLAVISATVGFILTNYLWIAAFISFWVGVAYLGMFTIEQAEKVKVKKKEKEVVFKAQRRLDPFGSGPVRTAGRAT